MLSNLWSKGFRSFCFVRWGFPTDRKDYEGEKIDSCSIEIDSISHHYDPDSNGIGSTGMRIMFSKLQLHSLIGQENLGHL